MAFQKVCCHSNQRCTSGGVWKIIAGTSNVKMWVANWMLRINAMLKGRDRKKEGRFTKWFWSLFFLDVSGAGDRIYWNRSLWPPDWNYSAVKLYNVVTEGQGAWKRALDPRMSARFASERSGTQFSSSSSRHVICYSRDLQIGVRIRPRVRVFRTEHALFGSEGDNFLSALAQNLKLALTVVAVLQSEGRF